MDGRLGRDTNGVSEFGRVWERGRMRRLGVVGTGGEGTRCLGGEGRGNVAGCGEGVWGGATLEAGGGGAIHLGMGWGVW